MDNRNEERPDLQQAVADFKAAFWKAVTPLLEPLVNRLSRLLGGRRV